jgi:hypothetical protein
MKSIIFSTLICFFILALSFQTFGEEWTAEQKEVWSVVEQYYSNIDNGDVASTMELTHEKALELFSDNPIPLKGNQIKVGLDKYASVKPTTKIKPISITVIDHKVANVFYHFKWESKDGTYSNKGRTMRTFIKQDDKWINIGSSSSSCNKPSPCPYGW